MAEEYTFMWGTGPTGVVITGDFDGWVGTTHMEFNEGHQKFEAVLPVSFDSDGRFVFKFVVDGEWAVSQDYKIETDEFGNQNNYIEGHDMIVQAEEREKNRGELAGADMLNEELSHELQVEKHELEQTTQEQDPGKHMQGRMQRMMEEPEPVSAAVGVLDTDPVPVRELSQSEEDLMDVSRAEDAAASGSDFETASVTDSQEDGEAPVNVPGYLPHPQTSVVAKSATPTADSITEEPSVTGAVNPLVNFRPDRKKQLVVAEQTQRGADAEDSEQSSFQHMAGVFAAKEKVDAVPAQRGDVTTDRADEPVTETAQSSTADLNGAEVSKDQSLETAPPLPDEIAKEVAQEPVQEPVQESVQEPVQEPTAETPNNLANSTEPDGKSITAVVPTSVDAESPSKRRKLKIKKKVRRNKKTGERVVVQEVIHELDENDNIIATYSSMEEAEQQGRNVAATDASPTLETNSNNDARLFEIQSVNSSRSNTVSIEAEPPQRKKDAVEEAPKYTERVEKVAEKPKPAEATKEAEAATNAGSKSTPKTETDAEVKPKAETKSKSKSKTKPKSETDAKASTNATTTKAKTDHKKQSKTSTSTAKKNQNPNQKRSTATGRDEQRKKEGGFFGKMRKFLL
ncbi:Mdg1p KNAG_0F01330 [Huiozyma naganishii CBS 8797]|uniref:AMP-activated protein kinase glycogen-binding domain-containing protein n=1 Tax=Huiozyma naganishii (strain ATCC MYA-139 / BCRC 22969 / CBS 8797 / KCTC 17520 / NBRC 10181 / NCYC 3082 / Yp74L-3) TaxID=1071383 RepID=J7S8A1_HUIN7|nr:hypothetical protein KNAG_0F01330 [Kazachstania naganishii CBS 8797]CCK70801.1 hypothetical protein KNAG_0F01330 [Kazachstania naganishii CBS 8797]